MNRRTMIISTIAGVLTFGLAWFLHDIKHFMGGITAADKANDSLRKTNPGSVTISQEQLDSLLIAKNSNNKTEGFSGKISGRFIMKGANSAGFDFINATTVLWTNETAPLQPDTLKIRWLDHATFMTRSTERINKDCPPLVWIYQVISFDGHQLILKDIWTGWNDHDDERTEFTRQTDKN